MRLLFLLGHWLQPCCVVCCVLTHVTHHSPCKVWGAAWRGTLTWQEDQTAPVHPDDDDDGCATATPVNVAAAGQGEQGQRGKEAPGGLAMPPRLYEDYYMDCDTFNLAFAPTVFDRSGSVVTASVILLVGGATLLLRHCVDVLAL